MPAVHPPLEPLKPEFTIQSLSSEQLDQLQEATLNILENVGVRFPSEKALTVFEEHGAEVDWDKEIVKMSPELVRKALATAPRYFTMGARDPAFDLLDRVVSMRIAIDFSEDEDLRSLHGLPRFPSLVERYEAAIAPSTVSEVAFSLDDPEFVPEDVAWDPVFGEPSFPYSARNTSTGSMRALRRAGI